MTPAPGSGSPPLSGDDGFLTDPAGIEALFGRAARFYVPLLREIIPRVFRVEYDFEDADTYGDNIRRGVYGPAEANRVYWRDLLFHAHMVVSASIHRTCRLVDASVRERRACNLPGWASCTRALLEAVGDSNTSLRGIPGTLAERHCSIRRCLEGRESGAIVISSEMEDFTTHFTHARRLNRAERDALPASHETKPAAEYVRELAAYGMPDAPVLYGELCALSHPAQDSVAYLFANTGDGTVFRVDPDSDRRAIDSMVATHSALFHDLLMVAANPILMTLRVFHAFALFPKIPELRGVHLDAIPAWAAIEKHLKRR